MGRPKAWLPWFGRTLVEHVVGVLREVVDEVVVVTSEALELPALPATVVRDREPERGPLAGLRDGLSALTSPFAFATATDAPFVRPDAVRMLLARGRACAPIADGHVQVLSAVYPRDAAALADALLAAGRARPLDLLEACDFEAIEASALGGAPTTPPIWLGFNTPADYLAAVRRVDPAATAEVELLGRAALRTERPTRARPVGTIGELLADFPAALGLVEEGRVARAHLVSLGGRTLTRDLSLPVGPGERLSVIDALAGG